MTQSPPTDSRETETSTWRRVIGFLMLPLALFPLLALCTYNWRSVSDLCIPAEAPTSNLVGAIGDWFAYNGYQLLGLGIWSVPLVCVYASLRLVLGKSFHPGRRTLGIARENVGFAIGVKVLVLVLAVLGLATMWMAVFADVGVTVLAVMNAMRALRVPAAWLRPRE